MIFFLDILVMHSKASSSTAPSLSLRVKKQAPVALTRLI